MMKFILGALLLVSSYTHSQVANDSVRIEEYIKVSRSDETKWIKRYQKDIDRYIDQNRKLEDKSCDVLIFGSSSINMWNSIYDDLAPLKVIRRSYGGASIRDMLYNYDVIARGYNPKMIVLYVENDLGTGNDMTVGDAYDMFRVFSARIKRDYPDTPFFIMSLKPSLMKKYHLPKIQMLNYLLKEYAENTQGIDFIDITNDMFDKKGEVRQDIFIEDGLHMNAKGYEIWTKTIKPILLNKLTRAQYNF